MTSILVSIPIFYHWDPMNDRAQHIGTKTCGWGLVKNSHVTVQIQLVIFLTARVEKKKNTWVGAKEMQLQYMGDGATSLTHQFIDICIILFDKRHTSWFLAVQKSISI